jgi:hypothetical protein
VKVVTRHVACMLFATGLALSQLLGGFVQAAGEHDPRSHHHGAAPTDSPEQIKADRDYSLFMHHSSGLAVVALGSLVLVDRVTRRRVKAIPIAIGLLWMGLGIHLLIRSDPDGWPMTGGFFESFVMSNSREWIQHKLLSLIPFGLGIWTLWFRHAERNAYVMYAMGAVLALGGMGLMMHQHVDHPGMDIVNLQHRFMAAAALFIAGSLVLEGAWKSRLRVVPYLVPCGLVTLGLQLAFYVE